MKWFSRILKGDPGTETSVEDIIRFYQQLGFFAGAKPESVVRRYEDEWGKPPKADDPWIDASKVKIGEMDERTHRLKPAAESLSRLRDMFDSATAPSSSRAPRRGRRARAGSGGCESTTPAPTRSRTFQTV